MKAPWTTRLWELVRHKFVQDTLALQLANGVQVATYFLTSVLTARYLGPADLGRWVTTREIFNIAYFLVNMGVVNAIVSRYSEAVGRQDRQAGVDALAALLKIGGVTAALLITLGFVVAPAVGEKFYGDRLIGTYASWLCVAGVVEVLRGLTVAVLQGSRQMERFAFFDVASNALRAGLVTFVLLSGLGLPGVVGAFLVHMGVTGVLSMLAYRGARRGPAKLAPPPLREVLAAVPGAPVRAVLGLSSMLALNKGLNTLIPRLGMLLIPAAALGSWGDNGAYAIAYVLAWGMALTLGSVTRTLLPALGLKMGGADVPFERMGPLLRRVSLASGGLMLAGTLVAVPIVHWVVRIAYGAEYDDAVFYFLWLALGNVFIGFTVAVDPFYIYSGRMKHAIVQNVVYGSLAVAGIATASAWYGPKGVAAAAGLCRGLALFHLLYMWIYFRRARALKDPSEHIP